MLFFIHLLKVSVCMAAFYGLYYFVLRHFTFYTLNRIYLLSTIAVSFATPMVSFETTKVVTIAPALVIEKYLTQTKPTFNLTSDKQDRIAPLPLKEQKNDLEMYGVWAYIFVALLLLLVLLRKLLKILHLSRQAVKLDNLWIVELPESGVNASFFNLILLNTHGLTEYERVQVMAHERAHARQLHSIDILLAELCKTILWANPVIYFYKKSLIEVHEFEADLITTQLFDSKNYAHLLLKLGINHHADLSHPFSMHPLSTRIQFLFKKRTSTIKKLLYIASLPLVASGIVAFAQRSEKLIYTQKNVRNNAQAMATLPKKIIVATKDTILPKNKPLPSLMAAKPDSNYANPRPIEYTALNAEIQMPESPLKHFTGSILTISFRLEKTPERYSVDFLKHAQLVTTGIPEIDVKVFRADQELHNGQDFDYILDNGSVKEVFFRPHIQSETEGVTFQLKKMIPVMPTDNKNKSPWRYKARLGEPIPYAPGVSITQASPSFRAIDSLKKNQMMLRKR